ncbi:hypothetical protein V6N12_064339 [Hibiscus sabdariffa]|uniref:Uncharacterized protein n=1 Tax=Hibiscus sabdariffa TaxID=183260 RepID=A0ABR2G5J3_9ROSI
MKPILGNLFVFLRRHPRTGSPISVKPPPENSDGLTGNPTCAISRSGDNRNDCRGFTDCSEKVKTLPGDLMLLARKSGEPVTFSLNESLKDPRG